MRSQIDKKYLIAHPEIMYERYEKHKDTMLRQSYELSQSEDKVARLTEQVSDLLYELEKTREAYGNLYQYVEALEYENQRLRNVCANQICKS